MGRLAVYQVPALGSRHWLWADAIAYNRVLLRRIMRRINSDKPANKKTTRPISLLFSLIVDGLLFIARDTKLYTWVLTRPSPTLH